MFLQYGQNKWLFNVILILLQIHIGSASTWDTTAWRWSSLPFDFASARKLINLWESTCIVMKPGCVHLSVGQVTHSLTVHSAHLICLLGLFVLYKKCKRLWFISGVCRSVGLWLQQWWTRPESSRGRLGRSSNAKPLGILKYHGRIDQPTEIWIIGLFREITKKKREGRTNL